MVQLHGEGAERGQSDVPVGHFDPKQKVEEGVKRLRMAHGAATRHLHEHVAPREGGRRSVAREQCLVEHYCEGVQAQRWHGLPVVGAPLEASGHERQLLGAKAIGPRKPRI
eukprot:scaffold143244_cov238-Phaeocystis_antarctica.AAC.1